MKDIEMKKQRKDRRKFENKPKNPNMIAVRFLHWDNETKKLSAITYKPYHFKLTKELNDKLKRLNLNKTLVLETKNNGKYSIAVIDRVYYEKNQYIVNKAKELDVAVSEKLYTKSIPKALKYDNIDEMFKDIKVLAIAGQKKLKWKSK